MSSLGDVGAGHTLGRYELLVPIAQGGMAVVWAARMKGMRGFQKIVAVKTMLPELSQDPQFEEMFLAEAGLASRIRHPHVCEILDLGEQDGLLYIVMEWIDGEPLSQLARTARTKGGIPPLIGLRICLNAALGLHAAHELKDEAGDLVGLVHRDVSPQNILVTYDGVVKIVDFGVAKATAESEGAGRTKDGQLKGKVPFMSPEQALGKAIDRRTDVFALGIVLYQLLGNKHPFRGDNDMITLRQICEKAPAPALSSVMKDCPQVLNDLVMKALEKDASARYQTMAEFARAIDRAIGELKLAGNHDDDTVAFVKSMLGDRADKRRAAIREGLKIADERAEQREQQKAQRAALLAQARASGGTIPPHMMTAANMQALGMPAPLLSIPPAAPSSGASGTGSSLDAQTIAHGRSTVPPGTLTPPSGPAPLSLATNGAVVADLSGVHPPVGSKKKLAVVGFALVGLAAIGGAIAMFSQSKTDAPSPASTAPASTPSQTTSAAALPPPPVATSAPVAHTASATPSAAQTSTKTNIGGGVTITTKNPTTKSTGTTKPNNTLPQVRDPGF